MKTIPLQEQLEVSPLDEHFARMLARTAKATPQVQEVAKLVSAARAIGHTCLPLAELEEDADALADQLRRSAAVGSPGTPHPLILDQHDRLYLQRYWAYEQMLAQAISTRMQTPAAEVNAKWLASALDRLLPLVKGKTEDQRRTVQSAIHSRFCVVTGGPGTGKTRTVAVILALLWEQAAATGAELPRLALAAPTGKAAARLTEALQSALTQPPLANSVPEDVKPAAVTLHRLLGLQPQSPAPRYDARHPLPADVVIIDEASMIDLALMTKLFQATAPTARLILLGDRDQLTSVEAGHVLGDMAEAAASAPGGASAFNELTQNFRFAQESGIHQLSTLVNQGRAEESLALLQSSSTPGLIGRTLPEPTALGGELRGRIEEAYRRIIKSASPLQALAVAGEFRILSAVRGGPYGVEHLNRLAESALASFGVHPQGRHYRGRPIMILQNEHHLGLFNGDIGVLLPDREHGGELRAFFPAPGGGTRSFHPSRLPEHESVWAMTVHKSQGSEFERILLILPQRDTPLLTRELIYTAITRARSEAEIWYSPATMEAAIQRRTVRFSGLKDLLISPER